MKDAVVIKGNKAGMTVYLEKDLDFEEVLQAIAKKFKATAKFWGAAQMTLTLEGRDLTPEEEYRVVQTITDNSDIEVLCLLDTDGNRTKKCEKALNERLMELSSLTGQFYKGNLRDGDELESEASIVVIGDVEKGAKVSAKGNIVVLGAIRSVKTGLEGQFGVSCEDAVIVAFEMAPMSVRIAGLSLKKAGNGRHLGRGPMMILSENGKVVEEPIKKSFLSALNFI